MWMRKGIFNFVAFIARCPVIPISFRFDEIWFFVESCFASETSRRHPSHINDIDNIFTSLSPFIDLTAKQKKLSSKNNFHVNVARRMPRGNVWYIDPPIIPHRNEFYEWFSMMYYSDENLIKRGDNVSWFVVQHMQPLLTHFQSYQLPV